MPLSEEEQRILQEIEQQFYADDPRLAGDIGRHSLYLESVSRMKRAALVFVVGVVILVATLATASPFPLAFGGFLVMLVAALWFERSLRRLGRAGMDQLADSLRIPGLRVHPGPDSQAQPGDTSETDI
ncbi:MAG: DUF3040 domain-containing protein [Microthrixaceae bacterium]|nr:DUF3040 domain-containing protein [Acidimicrobiales bacterium]MCB9404320.1 DUF3040 domain-containing protein [Microthrixaceae bacterium]